MQKAESKKPTTGSGKQKHQHPRKDGSVRPQGSSGGTQQAENPVSDDTRAKMVSSTKSKRSEQEGRRKKTKTQGPAPFSSWAPTSAAKGVSLKRNNPIPSCSLRTQCRLHIQRIRTLMHSGGPTQAGLHMLPTPTARGSEILIGKTSSMARGKAGSTDERESLLTTLQVHKKQTSPGRLQELVLDNYSCFP